MEVSSSRKPRAKGTPRKHAKLRAPQRVDHRDEEYYLERALQTPGLLDNDGYLWVLQRLMAVRNGTTSELIGQTAQNQPSDKLLKLLGRDSVQGD